MPIRLEAYLDNESVILKFMPKISVILPVYNAQTFILESVNSILAQSYRDFELILVDDASSDKTLEMLSSISDSRIRLIQNKVNVGLVGSINRGLDIAGGELIARMDHDDIALPHRFEKQVSFLNQHSSIDVLGSGYQLIDCAGKLGVRYVPPILHEEISWALSFMCPIAHPTVMVRRNVLLTGNGYRESHSFAEDYDLWERISMNVKFANLSESLLLLRKHDANMTNIWAKKNLLIASEVSARRIKFLLGVEVKSEVINCLYTQGQVNSECVEDAINLISSLAHSCDVRFPMASSLIRRDAAVRIAQMGLRSKNIKLISASLLKATMIYPAFPISVMNKLKSQVLNRGVVSMIG